MLNFKWNVCATLHLHGSIRCTILVLWEESVDAEDRSYLNMLIACNVLTSHGSNINSISSSIGSISSNHINRPQWICSILDTILLIDMMMKKGKWLLNFFFSSFIAVRVRCAHYSLSLGSNVMKFSLLTGFNFINNVSKKYQGILTHLFFCVFHFVFYVWGFICVFFTFYRCFGMFLLDTMSELFKLS